MEDTKETKEVEKPVAAHAKNPFLERLKRNQVESTKDILLRTICEKPDQSIGGILDALEKEEAGVGDFIMLELFKRFSLRDIAVAIVESGGVSVAEVQPSAPERSAGGSGTAARSRPRPKADDGDDDEFDDEEDEGEEDDGDDDGFDDEDEVKNPVSPRLPPKKKGKKEKKEKKVKKEKKGKKEKAPQTGGALSEKAILACLKTNKAVDEESAMSSQAIRDIIGGTAEEFRPLAESLKEKEAIDSTGKARGTKYYLI